jgi:anti-sigma regulatory factor (Ser/Thr protein kinase)
MAIDRNGTGKGSVAELSLADVIEIKLPPTSEYLAVVRATIGVIAGNMSFNYDEVIQLRVAVSEVFNLAAEWIAEDAEPLDTRELAIRFVVDGNKLEILVPNQISHAVSLTGDQMVESKALLESLMDEVEIGEEVGQDPLIRIAKYNTSETS